MQLSQEALELTRLIGNKELKFGCIIKDKEVQKEFVLCWIWEPKMNWTPIYIIDWIRYNIPKWPYFFKFEIIWTPCDITDLFTWAKEKEWKKMDIVIYYFDEFILKIYPCTTYKEEEKRIIGYNPNLKLYEQSPETLSKIIEIVKKYE